MPYKPQIPLKEKKKAVAEYNKTFAMKSTAEKYGVSTQALKRWVTLGLEPGAQSRAAKKSKKAKAQPAPAPAPVHIDELRHQLYSEVVKEYAATEAKLLSLHTKLKFLGEDWNGQEHRTTN